MKEFPLVLECKVIKIVEIGLHTEFIGEVVNVKADSEVLNEKGLPDIEKINPIVWNPAGMTYHKIGKSTGQAFLNRKRNMRCSFFLVFQYFLD